MSLGYPLHNSTVMGRRSHILAKKEVCGEGRCDLKTCLLIWRRVRGQGSQIHFTLGGRTWKWAVSASLSCEPQRPLPQEVPRPLGCDLKSAPKLLCELESVQTQSGSEVCQMSTNHKKSMCVGREVNEMFPQVLSDLLCFSSMTLSTF